MARASVVLGRDGMGPGATEADFESYVAYVCERIDALAGFEVEVEAAAPRGVQADAVVAADPDDRVLVAATVRDLWDAWCAEPAAIIEPPAVVWAEATTEDLRATVINYPMSESAQHARAELARRAIAVEGAAS